MIPSKRLENLRRAGYLAGRAGRVSDLRPVWVGEECYAYALGYGRGLLLRVRLQLPKLPWQEN